MGSEDPTGVQGGVDVATQDVEYLMNYSNCIEEIAQREIWRTGNPTGIPLFATDFELTLQPLKLLRNVSNFQISLDPHLQENMSLVDLVASRKKIIESKKERTLEDLKILHDTSKDLYHLAGSVYGERFGISLSIEQEKIKSQIWQTRKAIRHWWLVALEPAR